MRSSSFYLIILVRFLVVSEMSDGSDRDQSGVFAARVYFCNKISNKETCDYL